MYFCRALSFEERELCYRCFCCKQIKDFLVLAKSSVNCVNSIKLIKSVGRVEGQPFVETSWISEWSWVCFAGARAVLFD